MASTRLVPNAPTVPESDESHCLRFREDDEE